MSMLGRSFIACASESRDIGRAEHGVSAPERRAVESLREQSRVLPHFLFLLFTPPTYLLTYQGQGVPLLLNQ
ncbi:hypothetical protein ACRRTK_024881 [Alexandromys fortis]